MGTQTWAFSSSLLKSEQSEPIISNKTTDVFVAGDKMQNLKQKLEFGKTCIHHNEIDRFLILYDFFPFKIDGDINKCGFLDNLQ